MKHLMPKEAFTFLQQHIDAMLVDRHQRSGISGWRKEGLPWEPT